MNPRRADTPTVAGEATRRLDQTMAVTVGASRVFALAQTIGIARSLRGRVRHPRALAAGVAALVAQSAWAAQRGWRNGSIRDPSIATSDALAQCFALVVEAASWGSRVVPTDARWSETFGAVFASWLPFEDRSGAATRGSIVGWLGTYAIATGGRAVNQPSSAGQRVNEATGHVALTMAGRTLGTQLINQAAELDAARAEAVAQAQRLAAERERHRQHRIIHDSALQILEAIAGGWDLDDGLLQHRIEYEIARLTRLLDEPARDAQGLDDQLEALVAKFSLIGLGIELDLSALDASDAETAGPGPATDALADATHEALMNVHKHAAVTRAEVSATTRDAGITVWIADRGRGFDPDQPRVGFGLSESIEGRMRDVGGTATVTSTLGHGTRVELWVPR